MILDTTTISSLANSPSALAILSILSFSESSFFIIPPEVLLLPMALAKPSQALLFGGLTSITSIFGALFGYWIGFKGGRPLLKKLFSEDKANKAKDLFNKYDASAILISAFTPIPFKIFTISAGAFELNVRRFVIASIIGRGGRYMLLSGLIYVYGDSIKNFIENQLDQALLIGTIAIIIIIIFYKLIMPAIEKKFTKLTLADKIKRIFTRK